MLSLICEVDFKNETNLFGSFKTYSHLKDNNHLKTIESSLFYQSFIQHLKTNIVDLENSHESIKKLKRANNQSMNC